MNALMTRMSPTATQMIRKDHAMVMAQFHKISPDTSDTVREAAIRNICAALEIHAQIEEELFYPALREAGVQSNALDKSVPEHDEMRRLIERARGVKDQPAMQADVVNELLNAVMHHVADEETQLLPAAERFLGKEKLSDLGAKMTARRMELAKPRMHELAADHLRAAPGKAALWTVGALVAGTWLLASLRRSHHAH